MSCDRAPGRRAWRRNAGLALLALAPVQRVAAQVCRPPATSNEARTLATFAVPLAFGPASAPESRPPFQLGLEGTYLPKVDRATATPTICQPGKGPENTDLLFAVPRPRLGLALPLGLALEASWIPPVRLAGVKANLFSFSIAKSLGRLGGPLALLRAHGTFGSVRAPITCPEPELADPVSECFHGMVSDDQYQPNIVGTDLTLGWTMIAGRLRPYLGAGYNHLAPRFQVNFTNQFAAVDRTRVEVNLDRGVIFGGATWQLAERLGVTTEIYAVPADAVTARIVIRRAIGGAEP
jgi:hypothetical protein